MDFKIDFKDRPDVQDYKKIRNNVIREKINIKNSVLVYIETQTVTLVWPRAKDGSKKAPKANFRMVPIWKTKIGKTSEFVDAGGYNRNERAGNWRLGMCRQRRVGKENESLGTERCENIKNLHINT